MWAFSGLAYSANALRSHRSAWPGRDDPALPPVHARLDGNNARAHQVLAEDIRAATGMFVGNAPLNLVYVADLARMRRRSKTSSEAERGSSIEAATTRIEDALFLEARYVRH